jgi:hypothetical protein
MTDKMISFLKHIGIENFDDFDIDFEMVGRNRFNRNQIDMVIRKNTPWKYHLLREFQDALNTINYPYTLRFSYLVRPNMDELISLFEDWYQTLYHIPHNLELEPQNDSVIKVWYANEAEKVQYQPAINDFKDFLNFLHTTPFSRDEQNINENLGMWVRNTLDLNFDNGLSKAKLATSMAVDAYKLLFKDAKSPYFVNPGTNTDMFRIYNAFTELISNKDKDIMNECEKTLLVKDIIGLNEY